MRLEKKSIQWEKLLPAPEGWGIGHANIPPQAFLDAQRLTKFWTSQVHDLRQSWDPNLDTNFTSHVSTVEQLISDGTPIENPDARSVAVALLCNEMTVNPIPMFLAQWGAPALLDALLGAQPFFIGSTGSIAELRVENPTDLYPTRDALWWSTALCRRTFSLRRALALLPEDETTQLFSDGVGRCEHMGAKILVAFLFNHDAFACELFRTIDPTFVSLHRTGVFEPFLACAQDEDTLKEIAPLVRDASWVAPSLIRNVGEFASTLAPQLTTVHFRYGERRNNTSLRIIRAFNPPNIKDALRCTRFSSDFDVAATISAHPDLLTELERLESDPDVGEIARVYRQRSSRDGPGIGVVTRNEVPPIDDDMFRPEPVPVSESWAGTGQASDHMMLGDLSVSSKKREQLVGHFEYGIVDGVVRGRLTDLQEYFTNQELERFPWEKWSYSFKRGDQILGRVVLDDPAVILVWRSSRAKASVLNQTGHHFIGERPSTDLVLYGNREALEDCPPETAIEAAIELLDHPDFHIRELAARTIKASFYGEADPVALITYHYTVEHPGRLAAFFETNAKRDALIRSAALPEWLIEDSVSRPLELAGERFSHDDTVLLLAAMSKLAGHIVQWSEDVTMAITMIDTFLFDELGDDAPEPFSHRLDYDSLTQTCLDVNAFRERFGERMGWTYAMLMVFGGKPGIDALFEEIGKTNDVEFNPLDMLASSNDPYVLTRLIETRNKLDYIDERSVERAIERAASRQGLTAFSIWMLNAPTFDLDGTRFSVQLNGLIYDISFEEPLVPIISRDGKALKRLPRPSGGVDLERYTNAIQKIRDIKDAAARVVELIENSMGKRERIPWQLFRNKVITHPWLGPICQKVVWGHYEPGKKVAPFRVDEFREIVDEREEVIVPSVRGMVGVISPRELSEAEQNQWVEILSSYEVFQPFDQFGRSLG